MTDDPLQKLIEEDVGEQDRQKLAELLSPYVGFDKNSHKPYFKEPFQKIENNPEKLEMAFIVEKARSLLFDQGKNEGLTQTDVISLGIMPVGSVKSTLKRLFDNKKINKNSQGKYFIPPYRLGEIYGRFSVKGGKK